jgi:hypothetical protein
VEGPVFTSVRARYSSGVLQVAAIEPRGGTATAATFDPGRDGGWCFQLFVNTDQLSTGYGPGIDYLVRGIEVLPGGGIYVRRAEGGGGPGGWGEAVGRVTLDVATDHIDFAIPLDMLGPDDGAVDYVLEIYRTVATSDGHVRHEFVAGYSGRSMPFDRDDGDAVRNSNPLAPLADRLP